jgi:large subunit ribosomal protein L25
MHAEVELTVSTKTTQGKGAARKVRAAGLVPGIVYGYQYEPRMVTFEERALVKALTTSAGRNVFLRFKSEDKDIDGLRTLVKATQVHPLKRCFVHVDFFMLDPDREINTTVPIRLEGDSEGVRLGGIMQIARRSIMVSCKPDALPEAIIVDVTELGPGDSLHVSDLEAPEGVKFLVSDSLAICAVVAPPSEEEAEEGEGAEGVEGAVEGEEATEESTEE